MLDFKELPENGRDFERLIREILFSKGFDVRWSGDGPDGGRDILCTEHLPSLLAPSSRLWLVQCKHFAHSGRAVGIADIDSIVDSATHHHATGYLLACSTHPTSGTTSRLEEISKAPQKNITAIFWDSTRIERLLSTPKEWPIAQTFFPNSAQQWQAYATERPDHWVVNYRGFYFHLSNRIGSNNSFHFTSIEPIVTDIELLQVPKDHFIRMRAVYYDDKHGNYHVYLDYMRPEAAARKFSEKYLLDFFRDGFARENGQMYFFDIKFNEYSKYSDHFDPDHSEYYIPYVGSFLHGWRRS